MTNIKPRRAFAGQTDAMTPLIHVARWSTVLALVFALAACGGGEGADGSDRGADAATAPTVSALAGPPTEAQRIAAATATAQGDANACAPVRPFYWEIGDAVAAKVSGSVSSSTSTKVYTARTSMPYSSASKWLYAAYLVERRGGVPNSTDVKMLSLRSGYTNFKACLKSQTIDGCLAYKNNGVYDPATDGYFDYGGGHMQKHASLIGLGDLDAAGLTKTVLSRLGSDLAITYTEPQPAGGAKGTPDTYARFLRKLLTGQLKLGAMLDAPRFCTNPTVCPDEALYTPIPLDQSWSYSIGHWIETDPQVGDGAFSSPGVSGFYPWIDAQRTSYGIVARVVSNGVRDSIACGAALRKAWATGVAQ